MSRLCCLGFNVSGSTAAYECVVSAPYTPQSSHARISRLQLALELVEESPIGAVGDNLLWGFFDCAVFAQTECIEADRILGIVVTPFVVRKVLQRLQRIVVALGETAIDDPPRDALGLGGAKIGSLQ